MFSGDMLIFYHSENKNKKETNKMDRIISIMKEIPKRKWNKVGEQLLLFGRYTCKSINPKCEDCLFKKTCKKDSD